MVYTLDEVKAIVQDGIDMGVVSGGVDQTVNDLIAAGILTRHLARGAGYRLVNRLTRRHINHLIISRFGADAALYGALL